MKIAYFFSPECGEELLSIAPTLTQEECEQEYMTNENFDVYKYSDLRDFEESFNNGLFVYGEGIVRFF
jgi:hypothetical protein